MPNDNNTNNDISIDERGIERSEEVLDKLFGDVSDDGEGSREEEHEEEQEEQENQEEEEESEDDDSEDSDDSAGEEDEEEDWDKEAKDEEEDEDPKTESAARRQAKLKGREAKELKAKLQEKELELERIRTEREELAARVQEIEAVKLRPEDHPEYEDLRRSIISDVKEAADLLTVPDPTLVQREFGNFMADYLSMTALDGAERVAARSKLSGMIVDKLKLSDLPYDELDDDEKRSYATTVNEVLKIVQRNVGKTKELQKLHTDLSERAKHGKLSVGVRSYENTVKEFKPVLDAVGDLADDVIEANPHAVESVVARLVKSSPKAAQRLEKARADVLEAIVGPRALTQAEIDKLEANGTDIKAFMAERQKAHRAKQQKLAAYFVQGLMTRSLVAKMAKELAELKGEKDAEEDELDAVTSVTKKKAKVKEKVVRPKDRPSPLLSLGIDDED